MVLIASTSNKPTLEISPSIEVLGTSFSSSVQPLTSERTCNNVVEDRLHPGPEKFFKSSRQIANVLVMPRYEKASVVMGVATWCKPAARASSVFPVPALYQGYQGHGWIE